MTGRMIGAWLAAAVALGPVAAQMPAQAPLPPPRPDATAPEAVIEVPLPKPPGKGAEPVIASGQPEAGSAEALCRADLDRLGAAWKPLPRIAEGLCQVEHPLLLTSLPDAVALSAPATLTCPAALALTRWVGEAVRPEAEARLESRLGVVHVGTSYACRSQRGAEGGRKLSEHAFANGVDIGGFSFAGDRKPLRIGQPLGAAERDFETAIRARACAYFSTVLGPGTDAAHAHHLHLDMRERKAGGRWCR
jgi:hypothetical protein